MPSRFGACTTRRSSAIATDSLMVPSRTPCMLIGVSLVVETLGTCFGGLGSLCVIFSDVVCDVDVLPGVSGTGC